MREAYERGPDGKRWPGSLKGLNQALADSVTDSGRQPETEFTLFLIEEGHAMPIRVFREGKELNYYADDEQ